MSNDYGNQAAFSRPSGEDHFHSYGLTKREYFAGLAMQGMLAANSTALHGNIPIAVSSEIAKYSIEFADELLKQLEYNG